MSCLPNCKIKNVHRACASNSDCQFIVKSCPACPIVETELHMIQDIWGWENSQNSQSILWEGRHAMILSEIQPLLNEYYPLSMNVMHWLWIQLHRSQIESCDWMANLPRLDRPSYLASDMQYSDGTSYRPLLGHNRAIVGPSIVVSVAMKAADSKYILIA